MLKAQLLSTNVAFGQATASQVRPRSHVSIETTPGRCDVLWFRLHTAGTNRQLSLADRQQFQTRLSEFVNGIASDLAQWEESAGVSVSAVPTAGCSTDVYVKWLSTLPRWHMRVNSLMSHLLGVVKAHTTTEKGKSVRSSAVVQEATVGIAASKLVFGGELAPSITPAGVGAPAPTTPASSNTSGPSVVLSLGDRVQAELAAIKRNTITIQSTLDAQGQRETALQQELVAARQKAQIWKEAHAALQLGQPRAMFPAPQPVVYQQPFAPPYLRPVAPAAALGSAAQVATAGQAVHYQGSTPSGVGVMAGQTPVCTQAGTQGNPLFSQAALSGFGVSPNPLAPPPGLPVPDTVAQSLGLATPTVSNVSPSVSLAPPSSFATQLLSQDTLLSYDQVVGSVFGGDGTG